jgi:hypothetical protein
MRTRRERLREDIGKKVQTLFGHVWVMSVSEHWYAHILVVQTVHHHIKLCVNNQVVEYSHFIVTPFPVRA